MTGAQGAAQQVRWTPERVAERMAEAADVLGRLPALRVYGYSSIWPRLLPDYSFIVVRRQRALPPDPAAISRMEETIPWSGFLEGTDSRIVWQRANGRRWQDICASVAMTRSVTYERWMYALCLIAWRLNGRPAPSRMSRRALIAHFRSKAPC